MKASTTSRIDVQLPQAASTRQRRELTAFARYCIHRLERELGQRDAWIVEIAPFAGKYTTRIAVIDLFGAIEASGAGLDGALSIWEAMCHLEQSLRESPTTRAARVARGASCV